MSDFKIGDKVNHSTFGPGVIRFGPFKGVVQEEAYLMECADGTHRRAAPGAITLEDQELVDAVARAIAESDGNRWEEYYVNHYLYRKNARAALAVLKDRGDLAGEKDQEPESPARVRDVCGDVWTLQPDGMYTNTEGPDGSPTDDTRRSWAFGYSLAKIRRCYGPLDIDSAPGPLKVGDRVRVLVDDPNLRTGQFVGKVGTLLEMGGPGPTVYDVRFDFGQDVPHSSWWCQSVERI